MPQDHNNSFSTAKQKSHRPSTKRYGCASHREEMQLLGLHRRLEDPSLTPDEKKTIQTQIAVLEEKLGL